MGEAVVRPYLLIIHSAVNDADDFREALSIDSERTCLSFMDGEPEDNNLSRNFSDVNRIAKLIKEAHAAGLEGRPLNTKAADLDWYDF